MKELSYKEMTTSCGGSIESYGCNFAMGTVGIIWSSAASIACPPAGLAVGFAWIGFQTWVCDHVG